MERITLDDLKQLLDGTRSLRVAITYECPLDCKSCYARGNKRGTMTLPFFTKIVKEGRDLGFNTTAFGGGEPLLKAKVLSSFLRISKEEGYNTSVTSSAYNLDDALLRSLVDSGLDFFQISLGFNRRSFEQKLAILSKGIVDFGINFLVDKNHIRDLPTIHDNLKESGAKYVVYVMPKAMHRNNDDLKFNKDEMTSYLQTLVDLKKRSSFPFLVDCSLSPFFGGSCIGTKQGISISPVGNVSTCAFCGTWIPYKKTLKITIERLEQEMNKKCIALERSITI